MTKTEGDKAELVSSFASRLSPEEHDEYLEVFSSLKESCDKFDSSEHPIQTITMERLPERSQKEKDFDEVFDVLMEAKVVTERALEQFEELRDKYGK